MIYCIMYFQLFVAVLCIFLSFAKHYFVFIHLEEEEKAGCFAFIVLQMYFYYKCSLTLPHGADGWSAVCDYGIS